MYSAKGEVGSNSPPRLVGDGHQTSWLCRPNVHLKAIYKTSETSCPVFLPFLNCTFSASSSPVAVIDNPKELVALVLRLRAAPWVSMDTEADSLHAYPQKLCLIQLSIPGEDVLVDPLAGLDLSALWLALKDREIIMHGADYDLRMLYKTYEFVPKQVFDTMLAARLLGIPKFSLSDLVAKFFGVHMDKAPQKANWAMRPLTRRMIAYAVSDTKYLQPLADLLRRQLEAKGRIDWHAQLCDQLVRDCSRPQVDTDTEPWRIKGSTRLGPRALAVLHALWEWREHEARSANRPPFFVLRHDTLISIAESVAAHLPFDQLIPARFSPRRRAGLLAAVNKAMSIPDSQLPRQIVNPGRRQTPAEKMRLARLRSIRDRHAVKLKLDPALIASRATLIALAQDWEANAPALLPWQRELLKQGAPCRET